MNRAVAWSLAFCLCWCAEQASAQGLLGKPSLSSQYLSLWIGDELDTKVGNGGRIQGNFPLMIPSDDSAWASGIDVTGSFSGIGLDLRDPSIPGFEMNMKLLGGDLGLNFFARHREHPAVCAIGNELAASGSEGHHSRICVPTKGQRHESDPHRRSRGRCISRRCISRSISRSGSEGFVRPRCRWLRRDRLSRRSHPSTRGPLVRSFLGQRRQRQNRDRWFRSGLRLVVFTTWPETSRRRRDRRSPTTA